MASVFPGKTWDQIGPDEARLDSGRLGAAGTWLRESAGNRRYRVVVVCGGRIVAEWQNGVETEERISMASAAKSLFSSMLGIAVAEGTISSPDDKAVEYYPEMMDVPEGKGPKPGRFAKPEDRDIALRQLICNTSGYMKPGETPGAQFHYQTYGMNILCHAIAAAYRMYDSSDPDRLPGFGRLIEEKIRDPIGGTWTYSFRNFDLHPEALLNIFGNYTGCCSTARDLARMGLLWLHFGRWDDRQVIPEDYMREASVTSPDILANCPEDERRYGHGFWTNDYGLLWPSLPRDAFAAHGAGGIHAFVCPSLDLVVAQSPGIYQDQKQGADTEELLERVVAACR